MSAHKWWEPVTYQEAENILERKLDRRRKYYKHTKEGAKVQNSWAFNGTEGMPHYKIFVLDKWTQECSGCSCDCSDGYGCSHGASGCHECGYTGRRRDSMFNGVV